MGISKNSVCVIGAGVAGLAAAYDIGRTGADVTVFDASETLGGLASSVRVGDLTIERFYHFICQGDDDLLQLADELDISDKLHWTRSRTAFFHNGTLYPFGRAIDLVRFHPIPIWQRLLFGLNVMQWVRRKDWERLDGISAKRWLIDRLGAKAYEVLWDPLLRVKFGDYHEQVSAAWIWHRIRRVAASRKSLWEPEQLGYLESGTETVISGLKTRLESMPNVSIRSGAVIQKILMDNMRVTGLRLATGEEISCSVVLSTVALQVLERMIPDWDKEYCHRLRRIDYIGVICGLFRLRERITNAFWTNINDPRIPYNGIIEYTNLNQHVRQALDGHSIVYVPYYLRTNSPRYEYSDEVLRTEFLDGLKLVNPRFHPSWVEDFRVYRERYAQAICTVGFANMIPDHRAPFFGLYVTDSTQYYPEDRTISAAIRLGRRVAKMIQLDTAGMTRLPVPVR